MTIFITSFPFFLLPGIRYFLAYLLCFFVLTAFHVFLLDSPESLFLNILLTFVSPYIVCFIDTTKHRTSLYLLKYSYIQTSAAEKKGKNYPRRESPSDAYS